MPYGSDVDPARLFGLLWSVVEPHTSEIIQEPWDMLAFSEYDLFYGRIVEHDEACVPPELISYLDGEVQLHWQVPPEHAATRAFLVMRAIDRAFRYVLPETAYAFPVSPGPMPGVLLRRMRDTWLCDGCLAHVDAGYVALLGPLTGSMRADAPEARNGDLFEHQFVNLTLVPPLAGGRTFKFRTLAPSEFTVSSPGRDAIGLAPIAQDHHDLAFKTEKRGRSCYLDAFPSDGELIARRTTAVVKGLLAEGATLVALPELVLDKGAIDNVLSAIRKGPHDGGRVLVLGTGLLAGSETATTRLSFNEAVVSDGRGRVLIRQRKLNHYSMSVERMRECGIEPGGELPHIENSASGSELCVCDIPGIGRLMVLICEDFAQERPGRHAAQTLSPDWIVTPVLDVAISPGRWMHQKSFSLGTVSKIVVSGSTTMSVRRAKCEELGRLDQDSGVAMLFDAGSRGAGRIVTAGCMTGDDRSAVIEWAPESWPLTEQRFRPR